MNDFEDDGIVIVKGCPVADGQAPCCHNCGGNWPGTRITTEAMTRAVNNEGIIPENLGCEPLGDRARAGLAAVAARRSQTIVVFEEKLVTVHTSNMN